MTERQKLIHAIFAEIYERDKALLGHDSAEKFRRYTEDAALQIVQIIERTHVLKGVQA